MGKVVIESPLKDDLTNRGFNKSILINSKQTAESLLEYGLTNRHEPTLYYSRSLGDDISFNISIDKLTLDIKDIDVLDEDFCQPYDYQRILLHDGEHKFAKNIYFKVNGILSQLQKDGIIEGFKIGMYV